VAAAWTDADKQHQSAYAPDGLAKRVTKRLANPLLGNSEKLDDLPQELRLTLLFD
jgi:hypothetical protein